MPRKSKYYDSTSAMQVLGCLLNKPSLLDDDGQYSLREMDFDNNDFHRVIYGCISNLVQMGAEKINSKAIEDYLDNRERSLGIYKANNGAEWLQRAFINAEIMNFEYYYNRLKKMTLLRAYDNIGFDVSWIYDPDNILDIAKKESQDKTLDEMSIEEIAEEIDNRVLNVREMVVDNSTDESCQIGDSIQNLMEDLKESPARGYPLFDAATDKIAMGARLGKFYLRSAATGVGKSRSMMGDACYFACGEMYFNGEWKSLGEKIPSVFISVELDKEELQTMALSFICGINEDHILEPERMTFEEQERLKKGIKILSESELYIEYFPNYSMKDIENCIKRNIRVHKVQCVVMDYITSSMKMIEEIARASKGMALREDQVLFQLSSKLKDIAGTFGVFIISATQINGLAKDAKVLDQNMLAGAKAIANRIDYGEIMVDVSPQDLTDIESLLNKFPGLGEPNVKKSIYKNRRGKTNRVICWMRANKGQCRYETLFVTDYNFNLIPAAEIGLDGGE